MTTRYRVLAMVLVVAIVGLLAGQANADTVLTSYWAMNDGSGTTAADSAGSNAGTFGAGVNAPTWATGKFGGGLAFDQGTGTVTDANGDYVGMSSTVAPSTTAFSYSIWAKYTQPTDAYMRFLMGNENWHSGTGAALLATMDGTTPGLRFGNKGEIKASAITDSDWHLIVGTFEGNGTGTKEYLYVDGVLKATGTLQAAQSGTNFTIGSSAQSRGMNLTTFRGTLDDAAVWNGTISAGEVGAMVNILGVNAGALSNYDTGKMASLFGVYDTGTSQAVGSLTWEKFTGVAGTAGAVTYAGGVYTAWFDGTSGVRAAVPEPGTIAMLAMGFLGLIAYAWRKRK